MVKIAESFNMNPTQTPGDLNRLKAIKIGSSSQFEGPAFGNPLELAMTSATGRLLNDSLQEVTKGLQLKRRTVEQEVLGALLDCLPPTSLELQVNLSLRLRTDQTQLNGFSLHFQHRSTGIAHLNLWAQTSGPDAPWKVQVRSAATQSWQAVAWQANVIQWLGVLPAWPELVRTLHREMLGRHGHEMQLLRDKKYQLEAGIQRAAAQWSHCVWELLRSGEGFSIQSDEVNSSSQLDQTLHDELYTGPFLELQIDRSTRIVVNTLRIAHLSPSTKTCTVEGLRPALDLFESDNGLIPFKKSMRTQHLKEILLAHVLKVWSAS